jgi:hypothetical protein
VERQLVVYHDEQGMVEEHNQDRVALRIAMLRRVTRYNMDSMAKVTMTVVD